MFQKKRKRTSRGELAFDVPEGKPPETNPTNGIEYLMQVRSIALPLLSFLFIKLNSLLFLVEKRWEAKKFDEQQEKEERTLEDREEEDGEEEDFDEDDQLVGTFINQPNDKEQLPQKSEEQMWRQNFVDKFSKLREVNNSFQLLFF